MLLVLILVVGAGVWLAVAQPWRGEPEAEATSTPATSEPEQTPEPSATPTPTPTPTPEGPQACDPKSLEVVAVADHTEYAPEQQPQFSIQLTNAGDVDCTLNVGTSTQTFTVRSGEDVWWRSTDCQSEPSDMEVTLEAGQTVTSSEPVVWDRTRSSVDTCESETRPAAPGGGASYYLAVSIGGVESAEEVQFLLH